MKANLIYLTQTDTTVGLVSQDSAKLAKAKQRNPKQPFLICVESFHKQKRLVRTPKKFKKEVRRAKKTTYLYPNKKALRVVCESEHKYFLKSFDFLYSSSANETGKSFTPKYARSVADVIVEGKEGFHEGKASSIYKLGKRRKKRVR